MWMRWWLQILQTGESPRLQSRRHPIAWELKRKRQKGGVEMKDMGRRGETGAIEDFKRSVCQWSSKMFRDGSLQAVFNKEAGTLVLHVLKSACRLDEIWNRLFPGVSRKDSSPANAWFQSYVTWAVKPTETLGFVSHVTFRIRVIFLNLCVYCPWL